MALKGSHPRKVKQSSVRNWKLLDFLMKSQVPPTLRLPKFLFPESSSSDSGTPSSVIAKPPAENLHEGLFFRHRLEISFVLYCSACQESQASTGAGNLGAYFFHGRWEPRSLFLCFPLKEASTPSPQSTKFKTNHTSFNTANFTGYTILITVSPNT